MKIKIYFLTRSREVHQKKVKPKDIEVGFHKGVYLLSPDAINYYSKDEKPKGTECFFFEGNSSPIPVKGDIKDISEKFLNNFIYENALLQTGAIPSERIKAVISWSRDTFTIPNLIKYGLLALIVGSLIQGWLSGV